MPKRMKPRLVLSLAVGAMALLVACGPGGMCESDADRMNREMAERMRLDAMARAASPTPTPTASAAASATITPQLFRNLPECIRKRWKPPPSPL